MPDLPRPAAILGGNRIPFDRSNNKYVNESNYDMLSAALDGLIDRYKLQGETIGEVVGGAVLKHSRDWNLVREVVLGSRLAPETPAYDIQQACGTGLEAAILVANKIRLGQIQSAIAGGVDTTSDAPIAIGPKLRKKLLNVNRQKDLQSRLKALAKIRPGDINIDAPANKEPRTGKSMGGHTAETAVKWGITREDQDQLTLESHEKLNAAYERGFFDDLITPYKGLERDANLRPGGTLEKLGKLKPVFGDAETGTMTAANSTPLSDGASVVLFGTDEWAKEHGIEVLAYFIDGETAAVDYVSGKEGLLLAPIYAVPRMLARNGLTFADIDLFEIHEAFAAQTLATLKAWEDADFCKTHLGLDKPLGAVPREKLNVNGGSLAAGHPFAATGGRLIAGLAKELHARGGGTGLLSVCAAGGLGVVALVSTDPTLGSKK